MDISNNLYSNIKVQSKYVLQCEENNSTTDQEELREESRIDILHYDNQNNQNSYVVLKKTILTHNVKWTLKILSNFVAFLENINFTKGLSFTFCVHENLKKLPSKVGYCF